MADRRSLYADINDCMKFINKFYPPSPGKSNKVLCFCPKVASN